jgi:hypothetical protein
MGWKITGTGLDRYCRTTMTTTQSSTQRTRFPERTPSTPPQPSAESAPELVAIRVFDDIYRIDEGTQTIGYIQRVDQVYVTLLGRVYNTSIEIHQCLDLRTAIERLRTSE